MNTATASAHPLATMGARRRFNQRMRENGTGAKCCSRCLVVKSLSAFTMNRNRLDGRDSHCLACNRDVSNAHYAEKRHDPEFQTTRRQRSAEYRSAFPARRRETSARYWAANTESRRAYGAKWRAENRDMVRAKNARRRARKRSATVEPFSTTDLIAHWLDAGYLMTTDDRFLCVYCGSAPAEHDDHAHPLAKGGEHSVWNLVPSCAPCNLSKNDRLPLEWIAERSPGIRRWLKAQGAL